MKKPVLLFVLAGLVLIAASGWAQSDSLKGQGGPAVSPEWQANVERQRAILLEKDPDKKVLLLDAWIKATPHAPANVLLLQDVAGGSIAGAFAEEGKEGKVKYYLARIADPNTRRSAYKIAADVLLERQQPAMAARVLKPLVDTLVPDNGRDAVLCIRLIGMYATALYDLRQYEGVLRYSRRAYDLSKQTKTWYVFTDVNEIYALALAAKGDYKSALPLMDTLVREARASRRVKEILREVYTKARGNSEGYDAYEASLQESVKQHIKEEMAAKMIQVPAPVFTLTDLDGNVCSSSQWAGKTVILDFWGTNCGPCKLSFPAMQAAVKKYKADTNVVFVFIDEAPMYPVTEGHLQEVRRYLASNGFSFKVLLDVKKPDGWNWLVGADFLVGALPTKFIIDKNGIIRFKFYGFSGDDSAAVEELSAMIQLAGKS